jgi:hypothetical protein
LADAIPPPEVARLRARALATAERHSGWHAPLFKKAAPPPPGSSVDGSTDPDDGQHTPSGFPIAEMHMWHVGGVMRHDQSFAAQITNAPLISMLEAAFDSAYTSGLPTLAPLRAFLTGRRLGQPPARSSW